MACCGRSKNNFNEINRSPKINLKQNLTGSVHNAGYNFSISFEYTGKTGLTVIGPVSGKRYRFAIPGERVIVDPRDRPSLTRVPCLRQVRN